MPKGLAKKLSTHRDVPAILEALGLQVTKHRGDEVHAECPKHYERLGKRDRSRDSWSVNSKTGVHGCWSCHYSGMLETLVADVLGIEYWDALGWLRESGWRTIARDVTEESDEEVALITMAPSVDEEWDSFVPPPKLALESRDLTRAVCARFDVRWDPKRKAWAIPVKTWGGRLIGYQLKGRGWFDNHPYGLEKSATLFGVDTFPVGETAVLLESPLDVLRLSMAGYDGGLASFGSEVSAAQFDLIGVYTPQLIVAMDWDPPGRDAAWRVYNAMHRRVSLRFFNYRAVKRRENGKRPKDVGEMTNEEIVAGIESAKVFAAAHKLLGKRPEEKKRVRSTTSGSGVRRRPTSRAGAPRTGNARAASRGSAQPGARRTHG